MTTTPAPKRGRGRPPIRDDRALTRGVEVMLTPAMHARIAAAAGPRGVSAWLREAAEARLGGEAAELHAWREGRAAGLREARAALERLPEPSDQPVPEPAS